MNKSVLTIKKVLTIFQTQPTNWPIDLKKLLRISEMGPHVNAIEEQITYICYFQSKCVVSPAKLSASIIALPSNSI